jgi:hypothetical protein
MPIPYIVLLGGDLGDEVKPLLHVLSILAVFGDFL